MKTLAILALLALAACGADGDPVPPHQAGTTQNGVTISGTAEMGVSGSF